LNKRDKDLGEAALRHLCLGTQIVGVRWFGHTLVIDMEYGIGTLNQGVAEHNLQLTVESRWIIFSTKPDQFPEAEENLPDLSLEERVALLARLADQKIVEVTLGDRHPHLILTFEAGSVFFLNGFHEKYECWNVATVDDVDDDDWLVVAVPGSAIGLFIPPGFA
jgi:hypothetical protein